MPAKQGVSRQGGLRDGEVLSLVGALRRPPFVVDAASAIEVRVGVNALAAVSQWRFEPGTKDGTPVAVSVRVEVNFHLN